MAFAFNSENSKGIDGYNNKSKSIFGGNYKKKDRPFCTHCNYHGHSNDKCYKIHGYLPGYKQRQRESHSNYAGSNTINQVSASSIPQTEGKQPDFGNFVQNLS